MESTGVRSTTRVNAGNPPERLGFDQTKGSNKSATKDNPRSSQLESQTTTKPTSRPASTSSVSGRSSSRSLISSGTSKSQSTVRQSEIDLDVEGKIDELEEQYDINERDTRIQEMEIKHAHEYLEALHLEHELGINKEEDYVQGLKLKIAKAIARKKAQLRREAEHQKQVIEEDENQNHNLSQTLGSSDDDVFADENEKDGQDEPNHSTNKSVSHQPIDLPIIPGEDEEAPFDNDELLQRLRNLKDPFVPGRAPAAQRRTQPPPEKTTKSSTSSQQQSESIALQFADVFTKAFERLSSSSSNTDKFLARQVQGKDLPIFNGKPEEWTTFITAFENSTAGCGYSHQDNLPRLQKCLKGEAVKTVQCLLSQPENVPNIIAKLKMRFGRPEHIVQILIGKARDVPSFKEDRLDLLIDFGLAVDNLVETIKALKCNEHLTSPQLLEEFSKKLPVSLRTKWIEWVTYDPTRKENLEHFAKWMNIQTEVACKLCPPKPKEEAQKRHWEQGRPKRKEEKVWAVADEPAVSKKPKFNPSTIICSFCKGKGHKVFQCRQFEKETFEDKQNWVRDNRHCFGCIKYGHTLKDCKAKKECGKDGCPKSHHPMLHRDQQQTPPRPKSPSLNENVSQTVASSQCHNNRVDLLILPVRLRGPKGEISTFAMLDSGATCSVVSEEVATKLGLEGPVKPFVHSGLHQLITEEGSRSVNLEILTNQGDKRFSLQNVRTKKQMTIPGHSVRKSLIRKWKHLRDLPIEEYHQGQPTILIGLDNFRLSCTSELRLGPGNAPAAGRTELGWVLLGSSDEINNTEKSFMVYGHMDDELHQLVKHHFTIEAIGVQASTSNQRSKEDITAQQILDSTIKRVGNNWETGLLWRNEEVELPSTKRMAKSRLYQMERRMDRDPEFAQQYQNKIQEYVDKGFARKLDPVEAASEGKRTFYLPHFMAKNPKKPKKLRFVFDAAAKTNNVSLNDTLLKGPDKLTSLPGVLLKFRQRTVALTGDIKDMFHRVKVRPEDAVAQRFLWRGMERDKEPDTWEMSVLIFGAACSPACAQEVKNRNALEFQDQYPEAAKAIITRHYVDDYLDSVDSVDEAYSRFEAIREVHLKGGFDLCNWISNSKELLSRIPESLHAPGVKSMDLDSDAERVLGLFWRPEDDQFTFSMNFLKSKEEFIQGDRLPTKRELLALVMSIYDPLGFLSHHKVKALIILQETWRIGIGWEDELPRGLQDKWESWCAELKLINTYRLLRCYSPDYSTADEIQMHVFCDASLQAYGAVIYFRIRKRNQITVSFVTSKARVAPTKSLTVPRLELQAALLGTRLAKFAKEEHEIETNRVVYWSDSSTVLTWLRTEKRRPSQYVSCRVGEILELTEVNQWKWIPTKSNVADELTRDNHPSDWSSNSRWVQGPDFLKEEEDMWPKEKSIVHVAEEDLEWQKDFVHAIWNMEPLLNIDTFSTVSRPIRIISYCLRFIRNCKRFRRSSIKELLPWEIKLGMLWWWRRSQAESFPEELKQLNKNRNFKIISGPLRKLNVILDEEGVIRVDGRLQNAEIPSSTKTPVILDSRHKFTQLLINQYHIEGGHHGQEKIANEIRQQYHIIHLRSAIRKCWNNCQQCQNSRLSPVVPQMGQLPTYRLEPYVSAFHNTGLDYFGPISVTVGRHHEKRWGALFTCLSVRAVHVEMTSSLSTDSCIMAIRRFVSRRGCPVHIYSDNGTNLVGANNELKKAVEQLNQEEITAVCTTKGITWHFIPPSAPHMGGSWERLVKSIKTALYAVLKEQHPKEEVLNTLIAEAEHIVNCHPLTHVSLDPEDSEALTPNHFLIGRSSNVPVPGRFEEGDLHLRKQWRQSQVYADHFWKRWIKEYLPTLLRRGKWFQPTKSIEVDDVVLVVDNQLPRNAWPMGIVIKLYPGKDGAVRVVDVKTTTGVYRRPVAKLCKLDVRRKHKDEDQETFPDSILNSNANGSQFEV